MPDRAAGRAGGAEAEAALGALASEDDLRALWERESSDALLCECLRVVRGEVSATTLRAFQRFALDELPADEVARELGVSRNAVFQAKRRVLAKLRELLPAVREAW